MLVLKWKEIAFIEKVDSRCFCWFPADVLVHRSGTPIWRLHTKLYKVAWNILANNSETVGHKDLRLGQIVYIDELVFYNISFTWLLPIYLTSSTGQFPIYFFFFCKLRSLNWFEIFNIPVFFRLLLVSDPCTALKNIVPCFLFLH